MSNRRVIALATLGAIVSALIPATAGTAAAAQVNSTTHTVAGTAAATSGVREDADFSRNPRFAPYFRQRIAWSAAYCPKGSELSAFMECARVRVPRDWYHLAAGDITIGISRLGGSLKQPHRSRLLLSNPGGPGGSGLEFGLIAGLFLNVTATHTTIGIDPRGVGMSTNLTCPDITASSRGYLADGDSRTFTPSAIAADANDTSRYYAACRKARGSLLPFINSDQTARDYNLVRQVLGYPSFDYYGVSYGTWLGAVLEKKFPSKVARIVLDGNVDWTTASFDSIFASVPMSTQASYDRVFLPWLGRHDNVYGLGKSAAAVDATIERLRAEAGKGTFGSQITPDTFDAFVTGTLYSTLTWDDTATVLQGLAVVAGGDRSGLAELQTVIEEDLAGDTASQSTYLAVRCNDTRAGMSPSTWTRGARARAAAYPLAGSKEMSPLCAAWPYRPVISSALMKRPMQGVLMLQTEADPVTGYNGALHTRLTQAGSIRMVNVDNAPGHGAGLLSSECAAKAAQAYLTKGNLPRTELYCATTPIASGGVTDTRVYEFFNHASTKRKLPAPYAYPRRDLREPAIDSSVAPISPRLASPRATPPQVGSLAATLPTWGSPWAEAFARALVEANQSSVAPTLIPTGG